MGAGLSADGEYFQRGSIPSGGAGTLSEGGFADFFMGVWLYRATADVTYATTASGSILHGQAGAREVAIGFNSAGAALGDLNLQAIYNSGGGTGTPYLFGMTGSSHLDQWVYYFFYEDSGNNLVAGYILLSDLATAVTNSYVNDNAGSQYVNTLTIGSDSAGSGVVAGDYAYARAIANASITASNVLGYASSDAAGGSDWGFWPLADNTDTGDDSGNSRTLTFTGTITSESSPTLAAASVKRILLLGVG